MSWYHQRVGIGGMAEYSPPRCPRLFPILAVAAVDIRFSDLQRGVHHVAEGADLFAAPLHTEDDDAAELATALIDPAAQALLDAVDALDPDALTPREALEQLYQLKRLSAATQL